MDYARVFTMYLVILGHLYNGENVFPHHYIHAFHMPLFFFISGILHKKTEGSQWKKYFRSLIVPFVVFNFLWFIFYIINPPQFRINICGTLEKISKEHIVHGPTWFLLSLLYCKIILDFSLKKPILILLLWICCFFFINNHFLKDIWLAQAVMAMPFFYIGWRYKDVISEIANWKWSIRIMGGAFLLIILLLITTWHGRVAMKGVKFSFDNSSLWLSIPVFYLNAFCGTLMVIFFSTFFKSRVVVTNYAKALITILCTQYLFIHPYLYIFGYNASLYITVPVAFVILISCYFIHKFIIKYCPVIIGYRS